jgi:hypothetical protein
MDTCPLRTLRGSVVPLVLTKTCPRKKSAADRGGCGAGARVAGVSPPHDMYVLLWFQFVFVYPPHTSLRTIQYTQSNTFTHTHTSLFLLVTHARTFVRFKRSLFLFLADLHLVHVLGHDDIYSLCGTLLPIDSYSTSRLHDTHPNETFPVYIDATVTSAIRNVYAQHYSIINHVEIRSHFVELAIE